MSYTFLDVRNFKKSKKYLENLHKLMAKEDKIFYTYLGRHTAIDSFIKVFDYQINEAIDVIQSSILEYKEQLKLRELLNLF